MANSNQDQKRTQQRPTDNQVSQQQQATQDPSRSNKQQPSPDPQSDIRRDDSSSRREPQDRSNPNR